MTKEYKVWVEVEELDRDTEEYTSDPCPEPVGTFATEEEARAVQTRLAEYSADAWPNA